MAGTVKSRAQKHEKMAFIALLIYKKSIFAAVYVKISYKYYEQKTF